VKAPKLVPLSHVGDDLAKVNLAAPVAVATCLWGAADVANTQARTDSVTRCFPNSNGQRLCALILHPKTLHVAYAAYMRRALYGVTGSSGCA